MSRQFDSRVIYSAAHVVADPLADNGPGRPATVDWDATIAYRRHLWDLGLGVADAMDTAQRGMGLDWAATKELIRRSAEAAGAGDLLACGVGTDQLGATQTTMDEIRSTYLDQLSVVEDAGAGTILMCSRAMAASAKGPDDYRELYAELLGEVSGKAIMHWLGPMFDPALEGYWGSSDLEEAADVFVDIITENAAKIDGIKMSLLDADAEIALRRRLPEGVRCYTGDDFNYPELIAGDDQGHSDALLGIFDPLAPLAAKAAKRLDENDVEGFRAILDPTVPLARKVFEVPTFNYKTGVVFLAWLGGHQDHFKMVGGLESARSIEHFGQIYDLALEVGLFADPNLAEDRFNALLKVAGQSPRGKR
ncbi:dihydrodipicolinate synthase family protein [Glycomyces buryatensis]|uniref:Dihydrodipicolinate synthase family protein n=1 Tax=Glycomyces buryatensis TaxID=2570927 RepID=A0A4S8QH86_9ACTN|nr:dihydrodipicolinate synthase family protein [Glycomyces buryatensis]THV42325.1 dihydrodipicolinate synthase family protein [Glycomyces buryatensis]